MEHLERSKTDSCRFQSLIYTTRTTFNFLPHSFSAPSARFRLTLFRFTIPSRRWHYIALTRIYFLGLPQRVRTLVQHAHFCKLLLLVENDLEPHRRGICLQLAVFAGVIVVI